jgi:hypothetical protein
MNGATHLSSPPMVVSPSPQLNVAPGTHISYPISPSPAPVTPAAPAAPQSPNLGPCQGSMHGATGEFRVGHQRKKLILCFDGTGNKFKGNSGDTNILKIFRMLDRSGGEQCNAQLLPLFMISELENSRR